MKALIDTCTVLIVFTSVKIPKIPNELLKFIRTQMKKRFAITEFNSNKK